MMTSPASIKTQSHCGRPSTRGALTPEALQAAYAELTKKAKPKDDVRAFVLLEVVSDKGLDGRYYPVQIDLPPPASAQMR